MSATHSATAPDRRRLLAAAALALTAATALTGCRDGQGVRDEGPSSSAARVRPTTDPARASAPTSAQTPALTPAQTS
ncbi:MAG: hypothetical protein JF597_32430 [Streptomyces sp.]|jgi:hypothetical protein|uniref:hypothetical protein n=1 Tax=Streptomyces sp. TaxID=1931 RepID=UPI0025CDEAA1|nr:hypothetical protein [Streptomyces sp.]MBW8798128.1 hypothetical protein [Streptomyces sp.]